MKNSKILSVAILIIAMLISYQSNAQRVQKILKKDKKRAEIMATISNDKDMMKEMMNYMMKSDEAMSMMKQDPTMSKMMMKKMTGDKQMMMSMMKKDPAMSKMMMENMMQMMESDTSTCAMMRQMMMKNEHMKGMMQGMGNKKEGMMKEGKMMCPMHKKMTEKKEDGNKEHKKHHKNKP